MIQLAFPFEAAHPPPSAPPAGPRSSSPVAPERPVPAAVGGEATRRAARARRPATSRSLPALERLARWLARRAGAPRRLRELAVVWNRRLRTALGRAHFAAKTIELNPTLLDRHPDELVPTLVHELCHLVAGPRAAHGARWREAMRALGAPPVVCHRLDVSDLVVRRQAWLWRCTGCGHAYRRRRRDAHRYRCGRCRGRLAVEGRERD